MTQSSDAAPASLMSITEAMALLVAVMIAVAMVWRLNPGAGPGIPIPAPSADVMAGLPAASGDIDTAVFAGGCFWGVQAVFQHTRGVLNAVAGYAGGQPADANYLLVSSGSTGHAEAVQLSYDPQQISYAELLHIYFSVAHDPTQLDRQHPDVGSQYRSAVFYKDPAQKQQLERYIAQLDAAKVFPNRIVTQLTPLTAFHVAEDEHQNYATRHPDSDYIVQFDQPRIAKLKALMPALYREKPLLVEAASAGKHPAQ